MGLLTAVRQVGRAVTGSLANTDALNVSAMPNLNIPHEAVNVSFCAGFINVASATLATDLFTIENPLAVAASPGVVIKVTHIGLGATQTTASQISLAIIKRTTLNTGGTQTTAGAAPMDTLDASVPPATGTGTANAIVRAYTVNPATLGTVQGSFVRADRFFVPSTTTAVAGDSSVVLGEFGFQPVKNVALRAQELLAINLQGVTITGGLFSFWVWWTEEIDRGAVYSQG